VAQGTLHDFEHERKALGGALASGAFVPSSNSARLLSFLCEKYFEDPGRELTEYEIALGALGRRSDFDSRNDSAVRVELHSLRKRLKEFYEAEGAALPMQIVLPPGQYAPQFLSLPDGDSPAAASLKSFTARRSSWIWLGLLAVVLLVAAVWAFRGQKRDLGTAASAGPSPGLASQSEVRLLAGFPSGQYIDQYGHLWTGDAYFEGGTAAEVRYSLLARTANPALYHHAARPKLIG
jgi:hypothetical protein